MRLLTSRRRHAWLGSPGPLPGAGGAAAALSSAEQDHFCTSRGHERAHRQSGHAAPQTAALFGHVALLHVDSGKELPAVAPHWRSQSSQTSRRRLGGHHGVHFPRSPLTDPLLKALPVRSSTPSTTSPDPIPVPPFLCRAPWHRRRPAPVAHGLRLLYAHGHHGVHGGVHPGPLCRPGVGGGDGASRLCRRPHRHPAGRRPHCGGRPVDVVGGVGADGHGVGHPRAPDRAVQGDPVHADHGAPGVA